MKAIICDVDGTLINNRDYELQFLTGQIGRQEYYRLGDQHSPPVQSVITFLQQAAARGHPVYYVTGRPEGTPHDTLQARLSLPDGTWIKKPPGTSSIAHKHMAAVHILERHRTAHVLDDNPEHLWGYTRLQGVTATLIPGWDLEDDDQPITPILPKVENI